jgi:hypothetical protein
VLTTRSCLLLLASALALACSDVESDPAPLDRFSFPVGLAVAPGGDLLVVSSNFDLRFEPDSGGSVLRVDAAATPATIRAGVRIPSYGGEVALADATACGLPRTEALLVSRYSSELYRVGLEEGGGLSCGEGCAVSLDLEGRFESSPYGVTAVCAPGLPPRAFVSFLASSQAVGLIAQVELTGEPTVTPVPVTFGGTRSFAYDAENARLYFTGGLVPLAPLRWIDLAGGCDVTKNVLEGGCPIGVRDLSGLVRGLDLKGMALSNAQPGLSRRAYVAATLYDAELAEALGGRPSFDIGGVLLVLDLTEGSDGKPDFELVRIVPLGVGVAEVAVLPARAPVACLEQPLGCPRRDVVAVSAPDDGLVALYDDEDGAIVKIFDRDEVTGEPLLGRQPFGLAAVPAGAGEALLYVTSFEESFVTAVRVPLDRPADADPEPPGPGVRRIGTEGR